MKTWLLVCVGAIALAPLQAQEFHRLIFDVGAGFTQPVGATGRSLDTGWNVRGGVGYNFTSVVGAMVQVEGDGLGINSTTLSNIGLPGGNTHVFSATIDPIVHLTPRRHFDLYLIGGGGMYRASQDFTSPSAPTQSILASYSVVKPGVNGGMGVALGHKWGGKFFAEARYHRIFMGNNHTDYVPVSFGFRW